MPKPLRVVVIAIILILVTGFGYLLWSNDGSNSSDDTVFSNQQDGSSTQAETEQSTTSGKYTDYSAEAVANATGQHILFFHAPWCPQCRQLEASIEAGTIPSDVTIFKVDYDSNQKLRRQYSVTIQTTLVLLDDSGNETKKYVAYDQPTLDAVIENLL